MRWGGQWGHPGRPANKSIEGLVHYMVPYRGRGPKSRRVARNPPWRLRCGSSVCSFYGQCASTIRCLRVVPWREAKRRGGEFTPAPERAPSLNRAGGATARHATCGGYKMMPRGVQGGPKVILVYDRVAPRPGTGPILTDSRVSGGAVT